MVRLLFTPHSTVLALIAIGKSSATTTTTRRIASFVTTSHPHRTIQQQQQPKQQSKPFFSTTALLMTKKVLVPIADGCEEIETTCITDTLVRFGAHVTIASVKKDGDLTCTMSRGVKFLADTTIDDATQQDWDLVAVPGGMPGAEHLRDSEALISILEKQKTQGKLYAAICASPAVVLASKGLAEEGATCYPAPTFRSTMVNPSDDDVVVTGILTTSKGPGTALKFALTLGEHLYGKEKAQDVARAMLVEY